MLRTYAMLTALTAMMLGSGGPTVSEPCTLYKAENLEMARQNLEKHKWARSILEGYKRRVAFAMEQDDQFLYDLVPELTPGVSYGHVCANCVGEKCSPGETGVFKWSIGKPDQVVCKYCGTVYPNPDHPETGSITAPRMGQTFTYYLTEEERAHPEDDTGKYALHWASWPIHVSWRGLIRLNKATWVYKYALPMAKVYALTGEVEYAEKCAVILDAFARRYPNWLYHTYFGSWVDLPPGEAARNLGEHPRAGKFALEEVINPIPRIRDQNDDGFGDTRVGFWGSGRFTAGVGGEGGFLLNCTVAYDLIRDAKHEDGTPVLSEELDRRIAEHLILAGCADLENYASINNKCGPGRALSAAVGTMFERPESVRRALDGFNALMEQAFHFDGFCKESPSYSSMHLGGMRSILDLLLGYSDPAGYEPEEGPAFSDLNPYQDVQRYRLALLSMVKMLGPDLGYPVIGDTHSGGGISPIYAEILADHYGARYAGLLETVQRAPLAAKGSEYALWHRPPDLAAPEGGAALPLRSEYFPGWQVAVLRNGDPHGRNAFYFNGYAMHGHRHYDTLGVIYHALDQEMASDRGYIWDDPRNAWTKGTYSHNLVTVDGKSQVSKGRHSTLELFGVAPEIEVIQASANAYEQCSQYRRTCALVQLPGDNSYAVDFFRVAGGNLHHYCFNSNGDEFDLHDLELRPEDGKISWMENLRVATPTGTWRATWRNAGVKIDLWMPTGIDRLIVTDAPGWRSYRGDQLHAPPITEILAERAGENVASTFAAVMAPYEGEQSPIISVRQLPGEPDDPAGAGLALVVELEGRTDYVMSALDDERRAYGPVEMAGRFGFASLDEGGNMRRAYLLDGTRLACGGKSIEFEEPRIVHGVAGIEGRTITLDDPLPEEATLTGTWLLAGGTGYEIESAAGSAITVREYDVQPCEQIVIPRFCWMSEGE